jgi:hypothetical protein
MSGICANPNDALYQKVERALGSGTAAHSYFNRYNGNIEHVKDLTESEILEESRKMSHNPAHSTPLDSLEIMFKKRLNRLKRSKTNSKDFKEIQIKKQQEKLKGVEAAKGVADVIDYLYDEAIGELDENGIYTGWISKLDVMVADIKSQVNNYEHLSTNERVKEMGKIAEKLQSYYDYAESLDFVDKYMVMYKENVQEGVSPTENSTLWKMHKLNRVREDIKKEYKSAVLPVTAKALYAFHSKEANTSVEKEYKQTMARLYAKQQKGQDISKALKEAQKKYDDFYVTEEKLLKSLQEINRDVPYLDKMFAPMINLGDYSISLFAKFVSKGFRDVRLELNDFKREYVKDYKNFLKSTGGKYQNRPHLLNKDITEVITEYVWNSETKEYDILTHNSFVQEIDYSKYNKAKHDFKQSVRSMEAGSKEWNKAWATFYANNREAISFEDKIEFGSVVKGINNLVSEQKEKLERGQISPESFADWVIANIGNRGISKKKYMYDLADDSGATTKTLDKVKYAQALINTFDNRVSDTANELFFKGELSQPKKSKYTNAKWNALNTNPAAKEYHSKSVTKYFKSQERIPNSKRNGYIMPYKHKTRKEQAFENNIKGAIKTAAKEAFVIRKNDQEYGDPEESKINPIYFTDYIPANDSSLDVFESILEFEKMSLMYSKVNEIEPTANALKILINDRETFKTGPGGQNLYSKVAKSLNIEKYVKKEGLSNASEMLDWFIDQQLYHEYNLDESIDTPIGKVDMGKTAATFMSVASMAMLGGPEFLKSTANWAQATVQKQIEAFSKEFFTHKDLAYGEAQFIKHSKNILNDFASPISISLEGQLIDKYDFIQGRFMDEFGNDVSGTALKKLATSGTWMFMNNAAEYQTQVAFGFSLMNTIKLKDKTGKTINLKEAHELVDGKLQIKEGVTKEDGTEWTTDDDFEFEGKLHAINKDLNGVYNSFDRSLSKRWVVFRLVTMFRGFLTKTVKKRWKSYGVDQELGKDTEGFYTTFYKALWNDRADMVNMILGKDHLLSDLQVANIRRSAFELGLMFTLMTVLVGLSAFADDDDELKDNYAWNFMIYELTRLTGEIKFYQPVLGTADQFRIFSSPSAVVPYAERGFKFVKQAVSFNEEGWTGNDVYKQDSGWNKKGDSKLLARFYSILGFNGNNMDPAQAAEVFNKF